MQLQGLERSLSCFIIVGLSVATAALSAPDPSVRCVQQLNSCSCRLADGRLIDLSPLGATPGPAFNYNAPDGYTYQFNPCLAYACGTESDAGVCQEKIQIIIQYTDFGTQSSAQFENDPASGQLRLRYQSRDVTKTSLVNLHCDPSAADASVTSQGAQDTQLTMDLTSRFACPITSGGGGGGGMSAGDILLIVTFSLLAVYLLAGGLINMLIRGQTGRQVVPNYDFWTALPGLTADGAAFAYQRARALVCAGRQAGGYADIK